MPKFMNMKSMYFSKLNLQLFAEDNDTGEDGDGDDQDEESGDDADEGGDDEPKFTQADIDKAVARTIAKERSKAERAARRKKQKEKEGSDSEDKNEDVRARKDAEARANSLEVRCACFEAGVAKDSVKDVTALAKAYMEEDDKLDLEDAIEEVLKKYPQFKRVLQILMKKRKKQGERNGDSDKADEHRKCQV